VRVPWKRATNQRQTPIVASRAERTVPRSGGAVDGGLDVSPRGSVGNAGLRLRSRPNQGRKHMQIEQLFTLAFAAMVVVLVLGFAAMHS
jgi:hypothetical protein